MWNLRTGRIVWCMVATHNVNNFSLSRLKESRNQSDTFHAVEEIATFVSYPSAAVSASIDAMSVREKIINSFEWPHFKASRLNLLLLSLKMKVKGSPMINRVCESLRSSSQTLFEGIRSQVEHTILVIYMVSYVTQNMYGQVAPARLHYLCMVELE